MGRPLLFVLAAGAALAGAVACIDERFPGEQVMGSYEFTATPLSLGCNFEEQPDGGFAFEGTFSRTPDNSQVWFTLQGVNRDAGFDGQIASSTEEALRRFEACECDNTVIRETVRVALLSQSQLELSLAGPSRNPDGGECPPSALDGGLPTEAEGAKLPGPSEDGLGFDAVRACGVLIDEVIPGEGCACQPCALTYELVGVSR